MSDQELEENARTDPDTFIADEKFWKVAEEIAPYEISKQRITIRIDADILNWLKRQGRGYQSRINAILRAFIHAKKIAYREH